MPLLKKVQLLQGAFVGVTEQGLTVKLSPFPQMKVLVRDLDRAQDAGQDIRTYLERMARQSKTEYYLLPPKGQSVGSLATDVLHKDIFDQPAIRVSSEGGRVHLIMPYNIFEGR
jgi:hypothetical protein